MKWIKKRELLLLIILALVAAVWIIIHHTMPKSNKTTALISQDKKVLAEVDLSNALDEIFSLDEIDGLQFKISNGQICFINSGCPDHICEKYGYLSRPGQLAVCMPNRVTINIIGKNEEIDMVIAN